MPAPTPHFACPTSHAICESTQHRLTPCTLLLLQVSGDESDAGAGVLPQSHYRMLAVSSGSTLSSLLGAGVHFPKYFKKFDALARKKKFPEISRARRLGQRYFPKYHVSEGLTSSNLPQTSDFGGFGGLKTNVFFASGAPIHGKTVFRQCRRICWHKNDILKAWFMVIQRNF